MKLHFESDLSYQAAAIKAVCDLFHGQKGGRYSPFTVTMPREEVGTMVEGMNPDLGRGNELDLLNTEIQKNLNTVQLTHGLKPTAELKTNDYNFTVEMETGTGKTYVYLRTIFQLHQQYGFTKYVIVVPSVAIKEGVYKSLEIMADHLRALYDNVPFSKGNNYFLYDSGKLGQVRNFATSNQIQVMVVTVGAINKKDVNNLYKESEKVGGEKPIDLIKATRPILIVDEPQSVDGGLEGQGKRALDGMNPLCTLRFSATHADKHHMVYRLDAIDAYQQKLVKQIEVASLEVEGGHNKAYVRVVSVSKGTKSRPVSAKIEVDVQQGQRTSRKEITVTGHEHLEQTTGRAIYADFRIGDIRAERGNEFVEVRFPGGERYLKIGAAINDVDAGAIQRQMIRRTIKAHLEKEMWLRPRGIKVLSLFFIDSVEKYRQYDADGQPVKGIYATIFEEEYRRWAAHPDYVNLFEGIDAESGAAEVHDGYFSIDKKGLVSDTSEGNAGNRENAERAYSLIMRDKERLLSFETPLKFIFSHSALREGWDNPNVFQICAIREMSTERERRQTIGRGLRLCVNQQGERVKGFETNTLTVIATESYEDFAAKLQKEIEEDTGIRFGIVESHEFANLPRGDGTGPIGVDLSAEIRKYLIEKDYIDSTGKVLDKLRMAIKENKVELPEHCAAEAVAIVNRLRKLAGKLEVKNADESVKVKLRREVYLDERFRELWDRIKAKTTYRVEFDNAKLIGDCAKAIFTAKPVAKTRVQFRMGLLDVKESGVEATSRSTSLAEVLDEGDIVLPDILTELQDKTQLTRKSLSEILKRSDRLGDFAKNPQEFIELAAEAINAKKKMALVDGIRYLRIGSEDYYAQELFLSEELRGHLTNMLDVTKSPHEQVVFDSELERTFAKELDEQEAVKVFAKLPSWFKVPTPLGFYEPDWAVLIVKDGVERCYFVVETKPSLFGMDIRATEQAKMNCGKAHFDAIGDGDNPAKFVTAGSLGDVLARC